MKKLLQSKMNLLFSKMVLRTLLTVSLVLLMMTGPSEAFKLRHQQKRNVSPKLSPADEMINSLLPLTRSSRQAEAVTPRIITVKLAKTHKDVSYNEEGDIMVLEGHDVMLTLFGIGLRDTLRVKLTTAKANYGDRCLASDSHYVQTEAFPIVAMADGLSASMIIPGDKLPIINDQHKFYFCIDDETDGVGSLVHQGSETNADIEVYQMILPIWLMIIFIVILLCLSGLFSGLNLGLMALDQTELKIVQNTGTESERAYANKIFPIRRHGNFLLCALLLGNVLVNNTLTILLDTLTSGLVAVIGATLGIVVFGEIIPQAICSRHGLAVGAYTIWLTKFFMLLTFPLSFPISILLDKILGAEIGTVYNKKKLIELLRVTDANHDLEKEEVDIVTGALVYKDKKVRDVMTKLEDVFMLPIGSILDFETISEIRAQGYSRIPVYSEDPKNIVHILFAKDLMFIDPDDKMPLTMVCEFYSNDLNFVFHDTPLNVMFNEFKSGEKGHMAFVQDINCQGDGDPYYETIGLVTLEDIIEEIIQQEIVDETDVITDNRTKKRRKRDGWQGMEGNFHKLAQEDKKMVSISPQLQLAVFQYLSTSIDPFKAPRIMDSVLKKLLTMDIFREIKVKKDKTKMSDDELIIMQKGKVSDFFVLIIEGKVEVNIGPEELVFESGPFTYFGIQALNNVIAEGDPSASPIVNSLGKSVTTPAAIVSHPIDHLRGSLRKAGTQNAIDFQPSSANTGKRHSVAHHHDVPAHHRSGSLVPHFVPDYTVKASTDVLYLRIKRTTYVAAIKASQMAKKSNFSDQKEIDRLMQKIAEDSAADTDAPGTGSGLLRSPSMRSPERESAEVKSIGSPTIKDSLIRTATAFMGISGSEDRSAPGSPKAEHWGDKLGGSKSDISTSNNGPVSLPPTIAVPEETSLGSSNKDTTSDHSAEVNPDAETGGES